MKFDDRQITSKRLDLTAWIARLLDSGVLAAGVSSDPKHIFGLHEPGGEWLITEAGRSGWIVTTHELGHDPEDRSGYDYRSLSNQGLGVIARLNHGYGEAGTLPVPEQYAAFAQRMGNFVANSQGCHVWIVGNEPNHAQERPYGMAILPGDYAECYVQCCDAIHELPGHEDDQVALAAVAPWNTQTRYAANESGDWLQYFEDLFWEISMRDGNVDAIALHTYTHGTDPALVFSEARMDPPFEGRRYEFRAYRDFMGAIPLELRHVPIYITETNQDGPWADHNSGWIQNAYREIQDWNDSPRHQQIRALILYRWPRLDQWYIEGKAGVYEDFRAALQNDYRWRDEMAEWKRVYYNGLEDGFYDQDAVSELTIPLKHRVIWDPERPRPEMDSKRTSAGHSEVYAGQYSAVGFLPYATFQWWVYTTGGIPIERGRRTRATIVSMIVAHGIGGDASRPGDCGMRVGISDATIIDPESSEITWSDEWNVVRDTLDNERRWVELVTDEIVPQFDQARLWVQCNADVAADISAGHWDEEIVEQLVEDSPPPPPPPPPDGEVHVLRVRVDVDGETWIDSSEQFEAKSSGVTLRCVGGSLLGNVWEGIYALAQRIRRGG